MNLAPTSADSIAFGRFRALPRRRVLLADDEPIKLGGRAFDLLMVLIESSGAVVSKDDLMARVWPGRVVTETNLQTQILALRRASGADRDLIRTVAGRAYQFTGKIRVISLSLDKLVTAAPTAAVASPTNLPQLVSELDPHSGPRSSHSKPLSPVHNALPLRLAVLCSDMVRDGGPRGTICFSDFADSSR